MFKAPFSFDGRIRRTEYGLSQIILFTMSVIVGFFSALIGKDGGIGFCLLFYIPLYWFVFAQGAKRCHDLGNSGWWQIIPFYGFWLLFQDGDASNNQYGEDPKGRNQNSGGPQQQINAPSSGIGYSGGYQGGHNANNSSGSYQPPAQSYQNPKNGEYSGGGSPY